MRNNMCPSVIKVATAENYKIVVEFDNHEVGILDMEPYLDFGVFSRLQKPEVFNSVRVSFDTVTWTSGIDLDPDFVYEKSMKHNHRVSAKH